MTENKIKQMALLAEIELFCKYIKECKALKEPYNLLVSQLKHYAKLYRGTR